MSEHLDRFTALLRQMFELDKSDLDFGIYRVINLRREAIHDFLTRRLPQLVEETLAPFAQGGAGSDLSALEADVYSALYTFFSRYYEEGDFISKRRYKQGVYAVPYEGEEVTLYWANRDQYYIKTSENFRDYTFLLDGVTVHFRLVEATGEQNNNKESREGRRTFMLFTPDRAHPGLEPFSYDPQTGQLTVRFVYDIPPDRKRKYQEENYAAIAGWILSLHRPELNPLLAPLPGSRGREASTLLERHLKRYTARNTFDYFIHRDLGGFLNRELDFFLKSEVMHLEDLDTTSEVRAETYLAKVRAIKRVGRMLIDFLAQLENFQKKLWLKKKFVVETNWCITLDRVDRCFWPEIASNRAQCREWMELYAIHQAPGWTCPPSLDFLAQNQTLILDTRHFSDAFKYAVLERIQGLDQQTGGLLIHSDNFQALRLLQRRYAHQVNYCYIDPPYNTDSTPILYKNGYRDSSWLSLMRDRIEASLELLADRSIYTVAIDDTEVHRLSLLLEQLFPNHRISTVTVVHNPKGSPTKDFNRTHEYAIFITQEQAKDCIARIPEENDVPRRMRRWGENSRRTERRLSFYPIYVRDGKIVGIGPVPDDDYHPAGKNEPQPDGSVAVWPIDQNGVERRWNFGLDSVRDNLDRIAVMADERGEYDLYLTRELTVPKTVWKGGAYDAGSYGNTLLTNILGRKLFDFPKSIHTLTRCIQLATAGQDRALILDFFAGSGTTGHAVINYNRDHPGSDRRFILAEMGEYFDTVTKPRILKVTYSPDWKDGVPLRRDRGVSQILKYIRLESYEDTLSNIRLSRDGEPLANLLQEDYLIHYMVDFESRGSLLDVESFSNPFAYAMNITQHNQCRARSVDLCETFHYLLGLQVEWQSGLSRFSSRPAPSPAYQGAVELVEDAGGPYLFRQIRGTLPDGRRALVIWRTVTQDLSASNAALDGYFLLRCGDARDRDVIFVNGDNCLAGLRAPGESWQVEITEFAFQTRMFEEV